MQLLSLIGYGSAAIVAVLLIIQILSWRTVVPPNDVHIVQARKSVTTYGHGHSRNVYYAWPSWLPVIGLKTARLTVSIFNVNLHDYSAYDKGRVPFKVDVAAFFRINNADTAAQRVASFDELKTQLVNVLQGACRTILAKSEIETILEGRSEFGEAFTREVSAHLDQWGVEPVKTIELMDIRDGEGAQVIANIMAKKQSLIEMQSRIEVAGNKRTAEIAEIEATQQTELRKAEALQMVGQRQAEQEREVGIAEEIAQQAVKDQQKTTMERTMAVTLVEKVRAAEIQRQVQVVQADQDRQTAIIQAEGQKQNTVIVAEGNLEAAKLNARAVEAEGVARGVAEHAVQVVPVKVQIELAREIGNNEGYQDYLIQIKKVEVAGDVGKAQAAALEKAEVKVIATTGSDAGTGLNSVGELFSPKGGQAVGAMLEGLANTETGGAIVRRLKGDVTETGKAA
jgi:flotillin